MTLVRSEQREPRVYSVQGSDVLMTVFARPGVVRYVFRFPFDRYVEDVLFLLLFLESTSYVCVCEFKTGPHSTAALMRARPRGGALTNLT